MEAVDIRHNSVKMISVLTRRQPKTMKDRRRLSSGMLRRVDWQKSAVVSEALVASIIRAITEAEDYTAQHLRRQLPLK